MDPWHTLFLLSSTLSSRLFFAFLTSLLMICYMCAGAQYGMVLQRVCGQTDSERSQSGARLRLKRYPPLLFSFFVLFSPFLLYSFFLSLFRDVLWEMQGRAGDWSDLISVKYRHSRSSSCSFMLRVTISFTISFLTILISFTFTVQHTPQPIAITNIIDNTLRCGQQQGPGPRRGTC